MRDKLIKDILIVLRDGYNNKYNPDYSNNRDNNGATQEKTFNDRRRSEHLRSSARGVLLIDTRYSLPDMPFFEDNGDIASFEAMTPEERLNTLLSEDAVERGDMATAQRMIKRGVNDIKAVFRDRFFCWWGSRMVNHAKKRWCPAVEHHLLFTTEVECCYSMTTSG
jgi:hypothetical protein